MLKARLFGLALLAGCGALDQYKTTLEIQVEGPVLRLDGVINTRSAEQFYDALDANPQLQVIELGVIDGAIDTEAATYMGYAIRDLGLATRLRSNSEVYSGGVDLFLAGSDRHVEPGGVLGVHEWHNGFGSGRDYNRGSRQHEPMRGYIEDMLGSDAFYWFTLQAAAYDQLHVMTRDEMIRYGVVTR